MENKKNVRYAIKTSDGGFGCTLRADRDFRFEAGADCPYGRETAAYAACRYIRHCPALRDRLIREAVRLGLTTGKGEKNKRRLVRTSAAKLQLPGGRARLRVSVGQGEIVVKALAVDARNDRTSG